MLLCSPKFDCIHPSGTAIKTPTCGCVFFVVFFCLFFLLHLCSFSLTLNSPLTRDLRYFPPACTLPALHSSFLLQSAVKNQERLITVAYINVWLFIPPRSHSSAPSSHISISPALRKYLKVVFLFCFFAWANGIKNASTSLHSAFALGF